MKYVAKTLLERKDLRGQAEVANFLGTASELTQEIEGNIDMALELANLLRNFVENNEYKKYN